MALDRDQVIKALGTVQEPELAKDIVTLGFVKDVRLDGTQVQVVIDLAGPSSAHRDVIERHVNAALEKLGVTAVKLNITPAIPAAPGGAGATKDVLPQVASVIAVGAGKGGVGKSTLAVNLALGLRRNGAAVGLMDGDIYGPSIPTMLGIKGQAPQVRGNKILPFYVHGIHAITIGALVEEDKPLIWRGPMAHGAFRQLLLDNTEWPELDYLVVDLPPGTGDVPLTLCQLLPLTGAVVVATPQQVALDDAVRAVRMFQQLGAPVLGLVENMSCFVAEDGSEHDIFGRGGTRKAAVELGLPLLGEIPMFTEIRVNSDAGTPEKNFEGNPRLAKSLTDLVKELTKQVQKRKLSPSTPTLNIT